MADVLDRKPGQRRALFVVQQHAPQVFATGDHRIGGKLTLRAAQHLQERGLGNDADPRTAFVQ